MARCRDYGRNYVKYGNGKLVTGHEKVLRVWETTAKRRYSMEGIISNQDLSTYLRNIGRIS